MAESEVFWVDRFADEVIAEAQRRAPGKPIVCASGLSPSGPIHLGNLREVMTPHLVADEIRRRGHDVEHLVSWDDYDRFRRVPANIDPSWEQHIGKPLSSVPAPPGSPHPNWAEHFKAAMIDSLAELAVEFRGISQTTMYTSGAYRAQILLAMRQRARIDEILGRYRTKKKPKMSAEEAEQASGAAEEEDGKGAAGYFPYKPYCGSCEKDFTTVTGYDDATTELGYTCAGCGHVETVLLSEYDRGKLVWKVDWPMRWAYEGVVFEPSGVDHQSPGSSFVVGGQIVSEIFGAHQPIGPMYAFVGIQGSAKMSSSRGAVPTPADALRIMEPAVLRWLYARRRPNQSFTVAFGPDLQRTYDEWDSAVRRVEAGTATRADVDALDRAARTATVTLPATPRPVPYRALASIVDITTGDEEQTLRILRDFDPDVTELADAQPRLGKAQNWVTTQLPPEDRTRVRETPDKELLAALDDEQRAALRLLTDGLDDHWSLDGLTTLVYGVPKMLAGLPPDTPPTADLKVAQRSLFVLLYKLLIEKETGPRLPTLLLAVGAERVKFLLTG